MPHKELGPGRVFLVRADHDSDLIGLIAQFAKKQQISLAYFTAVGALKQAKLGFYDQQKHEYTEVQVSEPTELASCIGNITKDGTSFVHAHAVLADEKGRMWGGHLIGGVVFAAEVHITELLGESFIVRRKDEVTGLALWDM